MAKIDETGNKYKCLTVIREIERSEPQWKKHTASWLCKCDCGNEIVARGVDLRRGYMQSCGCWRKKVSKDRISTYNGGLAKVHGLSDHYLYPTWSNIRGRCYNLQDPTYKDYGGRGIEMYGSWRTVPTDFIRWIEENLGSRPEGHTLDRIDNDGNYEPGNLRWAAREQQSNNRRPARYLTNEDQNILRALRRERALMTFPNQETLISLGGFSLGDKSE